MSFFDEAKKYIPGGVNSPVRAFGSVGGEPFFVKKGQGSHIWDSDNKEYIDYVCSWGPMILGHCDKDVNDAIISAVQDGTSFGAPTEKETLLAKKIVEVMPSVEKVRLVSSGTEAVMSALRLARAFTKRDKIIKFEGCYHGHSDFMLVKAGSGLLTYANTTTTEVPEDIKNTLTQDGNRKTYGETSSPGVPKDIAKNTIIAQYNNLENVSKIFQENKGEIACLIIEPVAANMGVVLPKDGFLEGVRKLCNENGALLIFDEVITGFRLSLGGAQKYFNINPDITTMGKIIGGGLPVGAYGGKKEIMDMVSPSGAVYQAGTLSGNPIAVTAGLKTLEKLSAPNFYKNLKEKSDMLWAGFKENLKKLNISYAFNSIESLACLYFKDGKVESYAEAVESDTKKYATYFHNMLRAGVSIAPAQFEAMFMSSSHSDSDIETTIKAHYEALKGM